MCNVLVVILGLPGTGKTTLAAALARQSRAVHLSVDVVEEALRRRARRGLAAAVSDPSGAAFRLWDPKAQHGAQVGNEPGAWNWGDLYTRDPAGASAVYAAVFG